MRNVEEVLVEAFISELSKHADIVGSAVNAATYPAKVVGRAALSPVRAAAKTVGGAAKAIASTPRYVLTGKTKKPKVS